MTGGDYEQLRPIAFGLDAFRSQSSQQAFIYVSTYAGGPLWAPTNPMNVPRARAGIVKLPSGDVLVAGGLSGASAACFPLPFGCAGPGTPNACCTGAGLGDCSPRAATTNSSAETYDPVMHTWTLTSGSSSTPGVAGGMSVPRIAPALMFTGGPDAGLAIFAGGLDV